MKMHHVRKFLYWHTSDFMIADSKRMWNFAKAVYLSDNCFQKPSTNSSMLFIISVCDFLNIRNSFRSYLHPEFFHSDLRLFFASSQS